MQDALSHPEHNNNSMQQCCGCHSINFVFQLIIMLLMANLHYDRQLLQAAVDELYAFRDRYFENHSIEQAHQKPSDVEKELEKTMVVVDRVAGRQSYFINSFLFVDSLHCIALGKFSPQLVRPSTISTTSAH